MKVYYVTEIHDTGEEFTVAEETTIEKAKSEARLFWESLTPRDKRHIKVEIRDYYEDADGDFDGYNFDTVEWRFFEYGMRLRGFSIGTQPKDGFVERLDIDDDDYYDILLYSRPLTKEETNAYDLDYLGWR